MPCSMYTSCAFNTAKYQLGFLHVSQINRKKATVKPLWRSSLSFLSFFFFNYTFKIQESGEVVSFLHKRNAGS